MKKIRFTAVILLIFMALPILCACGKESDSSDDKKTKNAEKILTEIEEAYELDDKGRELVADMFEKFDKAFQKLQKKTSVGDEEFYEYAEAVTNAFSDFNGKFEDYRSKLSEKISNTEDDDDRAEYFAVQTDYAVISLNFNTITLDLLEGSSVGEGAAEKVVWYVNELSNLFYGKDRITQDDMNSVAVE